MQQKFGKHIDKRFPFLRNNSFLIAISGGIDSVVLAHLCAEENLDFGLAHCNFQLRGVESDRDEEFVRKLAKDLDIPVYVKKFNTKAKVKEEQSIQLRAREIRYTWFDKLMRKANYSFILTAHHLHDDIETFFINLIRGTGLDGLTGIPVENNKILRPLLPFSLEAIEDFAHKNNIEWREDATNQSDDYLRNRIRHHIIPLLEEENKEFTASFKQTQNHLEDATNLIDDYLVRLKKDIHSKKDKAEFFSIKKLKNTPHTKAVLYQLFKKYGFTAWSDIYDLLDAQPGKQIFSNTHRLIKDRNALILTKKEKEEKQEVWIDNDDKKVKFLGGKLICEIVPKVTNNGQETAYLASKKLVFPLLLRPWKAGDVFQPFGMKGHKKISDFLKDKKLSLIEKENTWVLLSNNTIIWVVGQRIHDAYKIEGDTKHILKIELVK